MQIVINLSDKTYKDIKEENGIYGTDYGLSTRITGKVVGAIQSGTPLPKGHGDLIDRTKIGKAIPAEEEKVMECICEYGINVDKEELIKALQYDRNQYEKGFADALDRIREEIMELDVDYDFEGFYKCQAEVLAIIDKYRSEGV